MSNALAIAAVTAVLRDLLDNAFIDASTHPPAPGQPLPLVKVSAVSLDKVITHSNTQNQLNLFLYNIVQNAGWRNVDLPSRDAGGNRLRNPPLALDLYYLLTAYGQTDFDAELLLGYAMQCLHETPVLTRQEIQKSLTSYAFAGSQDFPTRWSPIASSDLASQVEQIKIAPVSMSIEEMSKLWAAIQRPYRPSVAYHISVVLIESVLPVPSPLPVRQISIRPLPHFPPIIESITPQIVEPGTLIRIEGRNLIGDGLKVDFDGLLADSESASPNKVSVKIPDDIRAGVRTVRIVHAFDFGQPSGLHQGFQSNGAAIMVLPQILPSIPPSVARGGTLTLKVKPPIWPDQRVQILLDDIRIPAPPGPPSGATIQVTLPIPIKPAHPERYTTKSITGTVQKDIPAGTYRLRIRVDGAESRLILDTDSTSPTYDQYIPVIEVTA